jgi:hypothetical protein
MSRLYLWFNPCAFLAHFFAHGTAGAVSARLSLRPLVRKRDDEFAKLGRKPAARTKRYVSDNRDPVTVVFVATTA